MVNLISVETKPLSNLTLEMEHWTERPARGLNDEATPTPTPGPVTLNFTPMPKEVQEKIDAEKSAKEKAERERFNKQEAEREANGDFSHAPGLTPEQREAAAQAALVLASGHRKKAVPICTALAPRVSAAAPRGRPRCH